MLIRKNVPNKEIANKTPIHTSYERLAHWVWERCCIRLFHWGCGCSFLDERYLSDRFGVEDFQRRKAACQFPILKRLEGPSTERKHYHSLLVPLRPVVLVLQFPHGVADQHQLPEVNELLFTPGNEVQVFPVSEVVI